MNIKAITVWQPYALLLILGLKRFETRSWPTSHRGPLVIHAAQKCDTRIRNEVNRVRAVMQRHRLCHMRPWWTEAQRRLAATSWECGQLFGTALGFVDLQGCSLMSSGGSEFENEVGHFGAGRYGWACEKPFAFDVPIPDVGKQRLWVPSFDVEGQVRLQLEPSEVPA